MACKSPVMAQRKLIVTTSRTKRSTDFIAHLQALDRLYGPKPGERIKLVGCFNQLERI